MMLGTSTQLSGLGLEAQRSAVESYLDGGRWRIAAKFTEIESGRRSDRPQLDAALNCRHGAQQTILGTPHGRAVVGARPMADKAARGRPGALLVSAA
jgi:hypothetical protein